MDANSTPGHIEHFSLAETDTANEPRARFRTILIGTETLLVECAGILRSHGHEIIAVVAERGPAKDWATREGIRHFTSHEALAEIDLSPLDYVFSITNLSVLPKWLIDLPSRGAINFHDGPITEYAGLNTPVWALLAGEAQHGVTWHRMTAAIDRGDILASDILRIDPGESALSLNTKCFDAGLRTFSDLVPLLCSGTEQGVAQPGRPRRWCSRNDRLPAAATVDWAQSAESITRTVSALQFGPHRNPLGSPKVLAGDRLLLVDDVATTGSRSGLEPGTVVRSGPELVIATSTDDVRIGGLRNVDGMSPASFNFQVGDRLPTIGAERAGHITVLDEAVALYEDWWVSHLSQHDPLQLPHFQAASASLQEPRATIYERLGAGVTADRLRAALVAYLARSADRRDIDIGYSDPVFQLRFDDASLWFAQQLPLRVKVDWNSPIEALAEAISSQIRELHRHVGIAADLPARYPELNGLRLAHPVALQIVDRLEQAYFDQETILGIAIASDGSGIHWSFDSRRLTVQDCEALRAGFREMLASIESSPQTPVARLPLLSELEREALRRVSEGPSLPVSKSAAAHRLIAEQARQHPERVAVTSRGISLSYEELDARSNQLARHLAARGVGPEVLVGLHLERSVDLVVAVVAIHKAGGAYVPLDPTYPAARLAHMIADSGLRLIITQESIARELPLARAEILKIDAEQAAISSQPTTPFDGGARPENLAYMIYTSGSTGLPKGVMVEHRNLLNFFAGMDGRLESEGVWLAVTSLSFDISVLELCWPLTRGYHVVVATEREVRGDVRPTPALRPVDFSLFYFASANSASNAEQYRLLLEGARFADQNGFEAVWTPERHFHAFGGLYPNPSVISAALAVTTSRVKLRGGSVVAPLHHPARIAEEWSLVDNLSGGRAGIAFASGWQPDDFLLRPENFADKNGALIRTIEDVRALWRGEKRSFQGPLGKPVEVGIFPQPIQAELPFWITSAGNPETFAAAGRMGANVLTHLLGQSVEEVAEKVRAYRAARREAGHSGDGRVTLMLHTFVGEDADEVRAIVREPLLSYLRTATNLLKQYAWSFPAFRRPGGSNPEDQPDLDGLSEEESEALLEHAFDRYFETSGLLGTPEKCQALVERLRAVGVDEIGCLLDFGVQTQTVLDQLPHLDRLRQLCVAAPDGAEEVSLGELIAHHGVTHLQCTPSLARMLADDPEARPALSRLRKMMVGGEAFPESLANDLSEVVGGSVMNMYGPTETTIWSTVHTLTRDEQRAPPLGTPLANQQIHVVDSRMEPVRPGTPGELVIGGDGVVRGYHRRRELTAERFVSDPFSGPGKRAYRTGDLVRRGADGRLEFLGRMDHQIKIRGYRVELGEIEAALLRIPHVSEAVVVARETDGLGRLVAYWVGDQALTEAETLRGHLRESLPDFMVPANIVALDSLPRTPNGKIDRNALPEPSSEPVEEPSEVELANDNPLQKQIRDMWRDLLKRDRIGLRDNFFDLGGHSLLAVQLHRKLSAVAQQSVSLTDIFRFPTIESLSARMANGADAPSLETNSLERARNRRVALRRRSAGTIRATAEN